MDDLSFISNKNRKECKTCGKLFTPKISAYILKEENGEDIYLCSFLCKEKFLEKDQPVQKCDSCGKDFRVIHNHQTLKILKKEYFVCSTECQGNLISDFKREMREASGLNKATDTTRKIVIYTQKGGTGKTTTALNLSVALANMGFKVLLIDGDPQGSVSVSLKIKDMKNKKNLYHVFSENSSIKETLHKYNDNLNLILANQDLAAVNINLAREEDVKTRHKIFSSKLKVIEKHYDYIITDCGPALSLLNQNLLYAADEILIPVSCDYLSFATLELVMATINETEIYFKHKIDILGILPTFYVSNTKNSKDILKKLQDSYGLAMILSPIKDRVAIKTAARDGIVVVLSPRLPGYHDYQNLAQTIVAKKRLKKLNK